MKNKITSSGKPLTVLRLLKKKKALKEFITILKRTHPHALHFENKKMNDILTQLEQRSFKALQNDVLEIGVEKCLYSPISYSPLTPSKVLSAMLDFVNFVPESEDKEQFLINVAIHPNLNKEIADKLILNLSSDRTMYPDRTERALSKVETLLALSEVNILMTSVGGHCYLNSFNRCHRVSDRAGNLSTESDEWKIPLGLNSRLETEYLPLRHTVILGDQWSSIDDFLQVIYQGFCSAPEGEQSLYDAGLVEFHTSVEAIHEQVLNRLERAEHTSDYSFKPTKQTPLLILITPEQRSKAMQEVLVFGRSVGVSVFCFTNKLRLQWFGDYFDNTVKVNLNVLASNPRQDERLQNTDAYRQAASALEQVAGERKVVVSISDIYQDKPPAFAHLFVFREEDKVSPKVH